ncbi:MAG: MFS transporter, partial [Candidatus Magasanikiibacteriota bacterium]
LWGPLAIIYFAKVTGSYALGLSIFSVVQLTAAIFELPTGILSDFVGRRKTMILGALTYVFAFVLYAVGQFYWVLILGAILEGLARSFYSGNNEALLYDSLKEEDKTDDLSQVMGKIGSMGQWALASSGLLGGIVASWSLSLVMWISVIPQVICLILALMIRDSGVVKNEESNIYAHLKESAKNFFSNEKLRLLSISDILGFGMGEASFQFRSAFVASLWPVWAIGIAQVLSNIGAAISFRFAGVWIKKFKAIVWLLVGGIYSKVIYLIALLIPSIISPALMSTTSVFYGVGQVAKNSLLQQEFSDKQRATMGSLNSFVGSIFFAIFAVFLGSFADLTTPRIAMIGVTVMQFVTVWIQWKIFKNDRA